MKEIDAYSYLVGKDRGVSDAYNLLFECFERLTSRDTAEWSLYEGTLRSLMGRLANELQGIRTAEKQRP